MATPVAYTKTAKSIGAGLASTIEYKFVAKAETGRAVTLGAITGASVYSTDMVVSYIPSLPGMFSFAGTYAMDVISSLISAILTSMFLSNAAGNGLTGDISVKSLGKHFVYSFGATVAGSYAAPMITKFTGL